MSVSRMLNVMPRHRRGGNSKGRVLTEAWGNRAARRDETRIAGPPELRHYLRSTGNAVNRSPLQKAGE